jgi:hypothetical protein
VTAPSSWAVPFKALRVPRCVGKGTVFVGNC